MTSLMTSLMMSLSGPHAQRNGLAARLGSRLPTTTYHHNNLPSEDSSCRPAGVQPGDAARRAVLFDETQGRRAAADLRTNVTGSRDRVT
jgi:hypothetical protein